MHNLVIAGTRPETIKLYPFTKLPGYTFVRVNQSPDLKQDIIDFDIEIGTSDKELEMVMDSEDWDHVIVQGDTRTAFRAALMAFHKGIPVAHVEAGLRTWDLSHPHPEEGYRRMIDAISSHHFCPTLESYNEILSDTAQVVGNTAIDTLLDHVSEPTEGVRVLVTIHRKEANVASIAKALNVIAKNYRGLEFVFFAHPNKVGQGIKSKLTKKYWTILEPLEYKRFVTYLASCYAVITDSGGLQEEAPSLNKPVLVARNTTERMEGVDAGCAILGTMDTDELVWGFSDLVEKYERMAAVDNPYGDGKAAERIHEALRGCTDIEPKRN